jgi:glycosyltransferase involved in cell wall biosynthesis
MELSKLLGPGHPPIEVTEHGVSASAAKLGATFDGDPQRLLFFGVLRPNKGLLVLLEAMRELPEFHLTIAGAPTDNEYLARIRKAISVLPEGRVELIPRFIPGSDIRGLFEANGTLLLPYTSFAAQSGVLSLAITYRTPVVVADTGALGETVSRFGLGEVVRPGDAADLARGVRQLLDPRRRSQCRAGLGVAGELLTWENMALATIRGYVRHSAAR